MTIPATAAGAALAWREENAGIFAATIGTAADQLSIQPLAIEKDYWVCEALRAMVRCSPTDLVFKGGTSLEKLRIIQRFSEDLDLMVLTRYRSRNAARTDLRRLCQAASQAVCEEPARSNDGVSGGEPGTYHRQQHITPPLTFAPLADTALADPDRVLIELGQSGGAHPSRPAPVTSLLARQLHAAGEDITRYNDMRPFDVQILHPGRTLIEKLLRVNTFVIDTDEGRNRRGWPRIGRQYYDIWALLGTPDVVTFLHDQDAIDAVLVDCARVSTHFGGDAPIPAGGFANSAAFTGDGIELERLRREHDDAMTDLYYGPEPGPTFEAVLDRVHQNRRVLAVATAT